MLVIGQCNRTVKGTDSMSCLGKWTEHVLCTCCCLAFGQTVVFFFMKTYEFFLKFCHSFD